MASTTSEAVQRSVAVLLEALGLSVGEHELAEVARRWQGLVATGQSLVGEFTTDGSGELLLPGAWIPAS